jgi:DNA-binding CsgD family transcriptional regulator
MHHTVAIYRKLGVRGRTEAVTAAARSGILPLT